MNRKNINTSAYPEHSRVPGKLAKAAAVVGVSALALGAGFSAKYGAEAGAASKSADAAVESGDNFGSIADRARAVELYDAAADHIAVAGVGSLVAGAGTAGVALTKRRK